MINTLRGLEFSCLTLAYRGVYFPAWRLPFAVTVPPPSVHLAERDKDTQRDGIIPLLLLVALRPHEPWPEERGSEAPSGGCR